MKAYNTNGIQIITTKCAIGFGKRERKHKESKTGTMMDTLSVRIIHIYKGRQKKLGKTTKYKLKEWFTEMALDVHILVAISSGIN